MARRKKLRGTVRGASSGLATTSGVQTAAGFPNMASPTLNELPRAEALPPDPYLLAQQAASRNALRVGDAWDTYQTGLTQSEYGFDPSGGIDPRNPYSRAALARRQYQDSQRGAMNSYAAQGQLYSGAYRNAQDTTARNYDVTLDSLKKGLQGDLAGITKGKVDRYSQYGVGLDEAKFDALIKALGGR